MGADTDNGPTDDGLPSPLGFGYTFTLTSDGTGAASIDYQMQDNGANNQFFVINGFSLSLDALSIPEPSTALLLGVGLVGLTARRRRTFNSRSANIRSFNTGDRKMKNAGCQLASLAVLAAISMAFSNVASAALVWQSDLDGDAAANVGGVNGTLNGDTTGTTDRHGNANSALTFDGSGDNVVIDKTTLPVTFTEGTASIWFRGATGGGDRGLINIGGHGGANIDYFGMTRVNGSNVIRADVDNGASRVDATEGAATETSNWHLGTMTWSGTGGTNSVRLYIDGVLVNSDTVGYASMAPDNDWVIGSYQTGNLYFPGDLDDAGIWDEQLSTAEAGALFSMGNDAGLQYGHDEADQLFQPLRCRHGPDNHWRSCLGQRHGPLRFRW